MAESRDGVQTELGHTRGDFFAHVNIMAKEAKTRYKLKSIMADLDGYDLDNLSITTNGTFVMLHGSHHIW